MTSLQSIFEQGREDILSIFLTADYPDLNSTVGLVKELEAAQVDFIEIGIPFSDPMADGQTIQRTSEKALKNGFTMNGLIDQIKIIRKESDLPIVLMGYFNPIYQFGIEKLLEACRWYNVEGIIIPDLTLELYKKDYKAIFEEYGVEFIFLVTPETRLERLIEIDRLTNAFIYLVSTPSITGQQLEFSQKRINQLKRIKEIELESPIVVGFGISDNVSFKQVNQLFDGAIVGSAFLQHISRPDYNVKSFINQIRGE